MRDVIVVGAGPADPSAACHLARADLTARLLTVRPEYRFANAPTNRVRFPGNTGA